MVHVAFDASRAYRCYELDLPCWVPGFGVGFAISKLKQIGVWNKLPRTLKDKAKAAKGSWTGTKLTQKDLDSIPDDAWETIARELGVRWRYATGSRGYGRDLAATPMQREPVGELIPAT